MPTSAGVQRVEVKYFLEYQDIRAPEQATLQLESAAGLPSTSSLKIISTLCGHEKLQPSSTGVCMLLDGASEG
jgi:hypothetical protein